MFQWPHHDYLLADAVWQFIGICGWVINFVEKVMKEAMLINATNKPSSSETDDLFGAESSKPST